MGDAVRVCPLQILGFDPDSGSVLTRSHFQRVTNGRSVHEFGCLFQPVQWRAAAVIESFPVGAAFQQDLDRLNEPGFHDLVQR